MALRESNAGPRLGDLLPGVALTEALATRAVRDLAIDSRTVRAGDVFFALPGTRVDGHAFAAAALAAGAACVVVDRPVPGLDRAQAASVVTVDDVVAVAGEAAHRFLGRVTDRLRVVAVTGTNGKSTTTHFVAEGLDRLGLGPAAVVGTLGHGFPGRLEGGALTTPDLLTTHRVLASLDAAGARMVAMEASSHALDQRRLAGVRCPVAVFTNLTRDHLDYHRDMDDYAAAKARLFARPEVEIAVANVGDVVGARLLVASHRVPTRIGYHLASEAAPRAHDVPGARLVEGTVVATDLESLTIDVACGPARARLGAPVIGWFNAENLLAAVAVLLGLGADLDAACSALAAVRPPRGRMERLGGGSLPMVLVDYSHKPAALAAALEVLRPHVRGRLVCVFGCGGDRDRGKRPEMGAVAARLADRVVVTDDNPRDEDGDAIVAEILTGIAAGTELDVVRDRRAAIREAIAAAGPDDVVLVAGKGHETYQEIRGRRTPFDDAAEVRRALMEWRR
ncbi:MAG: UDP-N-acetylmuramoyl-L-alanyl-D-glutamate--2,6-diaminopimelate ligase [Ectothiorhodospiraceae bacterium]|nr:UDP-N-acetylmuramoyl-L-alanyl-D-glutamate--2,6-diaminopimelate ligase [Ectothiorhodospiraceae bacterium]